MGQYMAMTLAAARVIQSSPAMAQARRMVMAGMMRNR